jgi:hypothetical protein
MTPPVSYHKRDTLLDAFCLHASPRLSHQKEGCRVPNTIPAHVPFGLTDRGGLKHGFSHFAPAHGSETPIENLLSRCRL